MWQSSMELQQAITAFLLNMATFMAKSDKLTKALEVCLYAVAFSAASFGVSTLVFTIKGLF
jgi:hypothetical protein